MIGINQYSHIFFITSSTYFIKLKSLNSFVFITSCWLRFNVYSAENSFSPILKHFYAKPAKTNKNSLTLLSNSKPIAAWTFCVPFALTKMSQPRSSVKYVIKFLNKSWISYRLKSQKNRRTNLLHAKNASSRTTSLINTVWTVKRNCSNRKRRHAAFVAWM